MVCKGQEEAARAALGDLGFNIVTGYRYLGGYIGDSDDEAEWIAEKVGDYVAAISELAKVAKRFPQAAYAGMVKSLQQEWQFLQRVTRGTSAAFADVETALREKFLPALFGEDEIDANRRELACNPVRWAGLALPDPTTSATSNWTASCVIVGHLVAALRGRSEFLPADHKAVMSAGKAALRARVNATSEQRLESVCGRATASEARVFRRGRKTGAWLSVMPTFVGGTALSATEFRDATLMRYARTPPDLPERCDGCGAKCTVAHALACKKGGLIVARHDEVNLELGDLGSKALKPSAVRDEPLINPGRGAEGERTADAEGATAPAETSGAEAQTHGKRGDMLYRGFWERGTDTITDCRICDTDQKSYRGRTPEKVLESMETEKKKKYLQPCLEQRRHFTPLVFSVDGLMGREAEAFLKRLSQKLARKWDRPYSQVCGYVKARVSIALVRATHLCLRGSRIPADRISHRRSQWEDGAGLGLFGPTRR